LGVLGPFSRKSVLEQAQTPMETITRIGEVIHVIEYSNLMDICDIDSGPFNQ
jgi:hypothetical protein